MSFFGAKLAIAYVIVGLVLAVTGGTIIDRLDMQEYVESYVWGIKDANADYIRLTREERISYSKQQVKDIVKRVWLYVFIGVGIGAAIHNWIPQPIIERVIGKDNPFAVILAAIIGIPMYVDIFGTIPIAEALLGKGVGVGTVLTFMMGVTALSLPSMIMLSKVVKPKLLALFIAIITVGIIIIGYLFNAVSFFFVA
jgi:uncharacterized membrane protein YraQ (UPF0718 family)